MRRSRSGWRARSLSSGVCEMELSLDTEACMGHGRCYDLAPQLFDADGEGHGVLLVPDVPAAEESAAHTAHESCPERAIALRQ